VQQTIFDNGNFPAFPQETKDIRTSSWTAASIHGSQGLE
jgi:hypothetical protein